MVEAEFDRFNHAPHADPDDQLQLQRAAITCVFWILYKFEKVSAHDPGTMMRDEIALPINLLARSSKRYRCFQG